MQVRHDLTKLNKFVKNIQENWAVRVGIFSNRTDRTEGDDVDNAAIGLQHELGVFTKKIPIRSWLRMPLVVSQSEIIREVSYGKVQKLAYFGFPALLKDLGFACENAILAAFKSGGFGTWKPISKRTADAKGSTAILIDTGQLRRSVASQVVKL